MRHIARIKHLAEESTSQSKIDLYAWLKLGSFKKLTERPKPTCLFLLENQGTSRDRED